MSNDTELIFEQFRLFRNEVQTMRTEMRDGFAEVRQRLSMLEIGQAGMRQDIAILSRVERIERRLELLP